MAEGSNPSSTARQLLEREASVFVASISIAEVVSVLSRQGKQHMVKPTLDHMRRFATVVAATIHDSVEAGEIHAAERARSPLVGLADAFVLQLAKSRGAALLTTDASLLKNRTGVRAKLA